MKSDVLSSIGKLKVCTSYLIDNQEIEKLKNLEVLVLNAIRIEKHFSHLNLKEALDLISLIKPNATTT